MQCVALSGCGHYTVVGMSSGHLEVFNMQSGIHRGHFGKPKGELEDDDLSVADYMLLM